MEPRHAVPLLAVSLAAGCASAHHEMQVASVAIVGNQAVGDEPIESGLATKNPRGLIFKTPVSYDRLAVEADTDRIESYYARRGYFSARVTNVDVERVGPRRVKVRFHVREGRPTRIAEVAMEGAPRSAASRLKVGDVLNYSVYDEVKQAIKRGLVEKGRVHARVEGRILVDRRRHRARIQIDVHAGPIVHFGRTEVRGLEHIPESAVRGRLAWRPGDVVTPERIAKTRGRLARLGLFRSVNVAVEPDGRSDVADVVVRVSEAASREVRLGGGAAYDNTAWEARVRAGYRKVGFLHPLNELQLELRPAYRFLRSAGGRSGFGGEARVQLIRHDLFVPRLQGVARVGYERQEIEAYGQQGPQARLQIGRPLFGEGFFFDVGWELEVLDFYNVHPSLAGALNGHQRIGFFDQSISLDRRDDLLEPRSGYYLQLSLEEGLVAAGGEENYLRGLGEARGYVPLGGRLVAASRVQYGRTLAGVLPVPRRFFAGGANSHRGFGQRQLSPVGRAPGAPDVPVGGDHLFVGSVELRANLFRIKDRWLGAVTFLDGGNVTAWDQEIDYLHLYWAAGGGLRYNTIVGPVRLDVGYRLNGTGRLDPEPNQRIAVHLSLGEAF